MPGEFQSKTAEHIEGWEQVEKDILDHSLTYILTLLKCFSSENIRICLDMALISLD